MDLIVLGCNGPYPAAYGATAGYLARSQGGYSFIALDMGSGVFSRIGKFCPPENISTVILTHLHYDHISDMGVFNYYLEAISKQGKPIKPIPCLVPPEAEKIEALQKAYPYFRFIGVYEGKKYVLGDVTAEFLPLSHGVTNYGVRLTESKTEKKLVYSGDTNVCGNLEKLLENCDLWLGSAPLIGGEYRPDGGHLSAEILQKLAEKYDINAVLTHLFPQHAEREYAAACDSDLVSVAKAFGCYHV